MTTLAFYQFLIAVCIRGLADLLGGAHWGPCQRPDM